MRGRWRWAVLERLGILAAGGPLRALLVGAWIVLGVVAAWRAFGWSFRPEVQYYKYVDEVKADLEAWRGKRLKVHGRVVPGSIRRAIPRTGGAPSYWFAMRSCDPRPPAVLGASYSGEVPDLFRSDAEVVVDATVTPDGTLLVSPAGIMTKCHTCTAGQGGSARSKQPMRTGLARSVIPAEP
jgi:cytochrome c-type biogenesis protein CcmE